MNLTEISDITNPIIDAAAKDHFFDAKLSSEMVNVVDEQTYDHRKKGTRSGFSQQIEDRIHASDELGNPTINVKLNVSSVIMLSELRSKVARSVDREINSA